MQGPVPARGSSLRRVLFGGLLLSNLALSGCDGSFQPSHDSIEYSLNDSTIEALKLAESEIDPARINEIDAFASRLAGTLDMLVGTPQGPGFMLTEDWIDEGFDPNYPQWPEDDGGSGEITDEMFEEIVEGNEYAFRHALASIDEGNYDAVRDYRGRPTLNESWDEHLAYRTETLALPEAEREDWDEALWIEDAKYIFSGYYPRLADAAELYRIECLHCHGPEGGGNGPTAEFLNPLPRDYRKGVFKFTAVKDKARPRREDLVRILDEGVYSTAMPSFRRFGKADLHGLADYVRLLAIRGEIESELLAIWQGEEYQLPQETIVEVYKDTWAKWQAADESYFYYDGEVPEATPELIARGEELFMSPTKGNCYSCHGEKGLGNGEAALVYEEDEDGNSIQVFDEDGNPKSAYNDDWGHPIYPRNLTQGLFRGGSRPIDIYRRIYAGINGGPMPAIGETKDAEGNLVMPPEDIWAVVHYVKTLSEGTWETTLVAHADDHGGHGDSHGDSHGGGHAEEEHSDGDHSADDGHEDHDEGH